MKTLNKVIAFCKNKLISVFPIMMGILLWLCMLAPAQAQEQCELWRFFGYWNCWNTGGLEYAGHYVQAGNVFVITTTGTFFIGTVAEIKTGTIEEIGPNN